MNQVGYKCDRGKFRKNNEDSCLVLSKENIYIVADGVGGNLAGDVASNLAVEIVADCYKEYDLESIEKTVDVVNYIKACITKANNIVVEKSKSSKEFEGMATTLLFVWVNGSHGFITNIGDSRCYIYRDNVLKQVTDDHTYVNTLIKEGIISETEAKTHKDRHMITRALGANSEVEADIFEVELMENDILLLCTDGLYGEVPFDEIKKCIDENKDMVKLSEILTDKANEYGGHDNITVICLKIKEAKSSEW